MNLAHLVGHGDVQLQQLLGRAARWQQLDACLKELLPANLRDYFQVACVRDGCLVVLAHHSMAASRLRMVLPTMLPKLQQLDASIRSVRVKVQLVATKKPVVKKAVLSATARASFAKSAQRLSDYPELSRALRHLSEKDA